MSLYASLSDMSISDVPGQITSVKSITDVVNSRCAYQSMPMQVTMKPSLSNTPAEAIRGSLQPIKSTVNHREEIISVYQVARMPPQQLAVFWQVHSSPSRPLPCLRQPPEPYHPARYQFTMFSWHVPAAVVIQQKQHVVLQLMLRH